MQQHAPHVRCVPPWHMEANVCRQCPDAVPLHLLQLRRDESGHRRRALCWQHGQAVAHHVAAGTITAAGVDAALQLSEAMPETSISAWSVVHNDHALGHGGTCRQLVSHCRPGRATGVYIKHSAAAVNQATTHLKQERGCTGLAEPLMCRNHPARAARLPQHSQDAIGEQLHPCTLWDVCCCWNRKRHGVSSSQEPTQWPRPLCCCSHRAWATLF